MPRPASSYPSRWFTSLPCTRDSTEARNKSRLVGDRAYDGDPFNDKIAASGIELIAPHRAGRDRKPTQDGRKLRRYKRCWKIERLFTWLNKYRSVLTR
ncbi:transposase [Noviherbaspirillum galbum]|uniref:Transposase n=1 Tax=Noviherbaspirillum galbum TaxID=2709383 RepID=A0A6B3SMX6_9BURK|nr:transposase [Noviherbaspirillum galbum]